MGAEDQPPGQPGERRSAPAGFLFGLARQGELIEVLFHVLLDPCHHESAGPVRLDPEAIARPDRGRVRDGKWDVTW
jgi:hypothetical protein